MGEEAKQQKHGNFKTFGNYMVSIADKLPATMLQTPEQWHQWWAIIAGFNVATSG